MAQDIHYCFRTNTEGKQDWNQLGKLHLHLHVWCQHTLQIFISFQLCWLQHISFSCAGSTACYQLSLTGIPQLWHLQHLGVSRSSRLHFHSFTQWLLWASMQGHSPATHLASATFLSCKRMFLNSKARTTWPKLPNLVACWAWNTGPLIQLQIEQLSVFPGFFRCLSLTVLELAL